MDIFRFRCRQYGPIAAIGAAILGSAGVAGPVTAGAATMAGLAGMTAVGSLGYAASQMFGQKGNTPSGSGSSDALDKAAAEQKALQDQQEQTKQKAATRLAASTSGFSGGSNTARSFLTTF